MVDYDVIIIGAGPAGAVSSAYLNNKGNSVLVIEKQIFPRFVIGESLLPHCMDHLEESGLLDAVKKAGFKKKKGAIFNSENKKCEFSFSEQYSKEWEWTWQVERAKFDQVLAQEVQNQGVEIKFNTSVKNVSCSSTIQEVEYEDEGGNIKTLKAKFVIDASGYGRVLPRLFKLSEPSDIEARGSVFTHVLESSRQ